MENNFEENEGMEGFFEHMSDMREKMQLREIGNTHIDILRAKHMIDIVRTLPDDVKVSIRVADVKLKLFNKPHCVVNFLKELVTELETELEQIENNIK